jgi:hypothetical protein
LDRELEALERELTAIEAYDKATEGKAKAVQKRVRSRRGKKRQAILEIVSQHSDGLSRGEILNLIGVKGDKSGEQSVSNAPSLPIQQPPSKSEVSSRDQSTRDRRGSGERLPSSNSASPLTRIRAAWSSSTICR